MAAVIDLRTGAAIPSPVAPTAPRRPALSVIEGGRSAAALHRRRIYVRRRVVAAVAALLALALAAAAVVAVGSALADPGAPGATSQHVVQRGDTLWEVAVRADPGADPRDVIDRIVGLNAGGAPLDPDAPLRVGQRLVVPAGRG